MPDAPLPSRVTSLLYPCPCPHCRRSSGPKLSTLKGASTKSAHGMLELNAPRTLFLVFKDIKAEGPSPVETLLDGQLPGRGRSRAL